MAQIGGRGLSQAMLESRRHKLSPGQIELFFLTADSGIPAARESIWYAENIARMLYRLGEFEAGLPFRRSGWPKRGSRLELQMDLEAPRRGHGFCLRANLGSQDLLGFDSVRRFRDRVIELLEEFVISYRRGTRLGLLGGEYGSALSKVYERILKRETAAEVVLVEMGRIVRLKEPQNGQEASLKN